MTARGLVFLLVATCLLSAYSAAQEVECYLIIGSDLRRLTFAVDPPAGYTVTGETFVGQLPPGVMRAAMTADGELLALDPSTRALVSVDTDTAQLTTVVNLDLGGSLEYSDIAVVAPAQIYLSQETRLYRVSRATGQVTLVGDTGFGLWALGSSVGQLYAIGSNDPMTEGAFLRIDATTAQASVIKVYEYSPWTGPSGFFALSSSRSELWAGNVHDNLVESTISVGVMDVETGLLASTVWASTGDSPQPFVTAVELRGPLLQAAPIPLASRPALAMLALLLAAAGVVAIRRWLV